MRIPTSVDAIVLLFAIPIIASLTNFVSDSTTKRSPRTNILPVISRFDVIKVLSFVVEINESRKKLSESTYGILDVDNPLILKSPPISAFAEVINPVTSFAN